MDFDLADAHALLGSTPRVLRELLTRLPDDWLHAREAPDAWSPYQVCGHLTYVEESDWLDRTRRILEHGTTRVFDPVDREAGFARYDGWSLERLLERFESSRASNLADLSVLVGPDELARLGVHPTFGEVTLAQLLASWVVHDQNHLNQLTKTLAKNYREAVGPWRAFLPVLDAP